MLLTTDRQLAAEVRALEAEEAPGDVDTLLFQLANCKEWTAGAGRREFSPEDREGEPPCLVCCVPVSTGSPQSTWFTVHQPRAVWSAGGAARAMQGLCDPPMHMQSLGARVAACCAPHEGCTTHLPPPTHPPPPAVLGKSSRRLLAFAVQRKWVAATRTLLSSVAADQPAAEAMAAVDVMCVGTTGMPLLQLAVRSQRLELVKAVLEWGDAHGEDHCWRP